MHEGRETVVVVAHPDDEILWFSSVLPRADNVVLAFGAYAAVPELAEARDKAVAALPLPVTFLRLHEAGSYAGANWQAPIETANGVALERAPEAVRAAYEANFHAVRRHLLETLHAGQDVYSHNPWGEYGHEDHILVFRAVEAARRELGFRHYVSAYVSDRSAGLAQRWMDRMPPRSGLAVTDQAFGASIEAIYRENGCWTWEENWRWPSEEWFFEMTDAAAVPPPGDVPLIRVLRS